MCEPFLKVRRRIAGIRGKHASREPLTLLRDEWAVHQEERLRGNIRHLARAADGGSIGKI